MGLKEKGLDSERRVRKANGGKIEKEDGHVEGSDAIAFSCHWDLPVQLQIESVCWVRLAIILDQ